MRTPSFHRSPRPLTLVVLLLAQGALAQPGTFDPAFGSGGVATFGMPNVQETGMAIAHQSTGDLILVGTSTDTSGTRSWIARFHADGTPDATFGTGGSQELNIGPGDAIVQDVAVDTLDRILVTGTTLSDTVPHLFVARSTPDGTPDFTFAADGTYVESFEALGSAGHAIAVRSDGSIVAAGSASASGGIAYMVGLNASGQPTAFAMQFGWSTAPDQSVSDLCSANDSTLLFTGSATPDTRDMFLHARDGALSVSGASYFGTNSVVHFEIPGTDEEARAIGIQSDGRIVIAGTRHDSLSHHDLVLARVMPDGAVDGSFGNGGVLIEDPGPQLSAADLLVLPDDRLLVVASTVTAGPSPIYFFQYLSDGTPDPDFGTGGMTYLTPLATYNFPTRALTVDSCHVLVTGLVGYGPIQQALLASVQVGACGVLPTGLPDTLPSEPDVLIYPNPAKDRVTVEMTVAGGQEASYRITDLQGREVVAGRSSDRWTTLDLDLSDGTYLVCIMLPDRSCRSRLVVAQ
ncbi:MAG: T9SS type A sorting domain-containing protein [Flavobacteriales bacterium]|nr:T9SS type A sorting domain-containing protein [Flavobacteriales bacterium]